MARLTAVPFPRPSACLPTLPPISALVLRMYFPAGIVFGLATLAIVGFVSADEFSDGTIAYSNLWYGDQVRCGRSRICSDSFLYFPPPPLLKYQRQQQIS